MKRFHIRLWLITAVLFAAACLVQAQPEEIIRFDSYILVRSNGVVTVAEKLRVRSRGLNIRHGIYRDFPHLYRGPWGLRSRTGFRVVSAKRNGLPEAYHTQNRGNGTRVYLGTANRELPPGLYDYELAYETDNQVGFFPSHDELYWNVTGNGWQFRIQKATATVVLPSGVGPTNLMAYTGRQGTRGDAYSAKVIDGKAYFETTQPLNPSEGLTVVVEWPKGFVTPPTAWDRCRELARANLGVVSGAAGLLLVLAYYLTVWVCVGRDPQAGTIIPLYGPPESFSPAAVRYLARMGEFDNRTLTAAILNLAVQGQLTIREYQNKAYTLFRTETGTKGLQPEEVGLLNKLFRDGRRLALKQTNHETLQKARKELKNRLSKHVEKTFFVRNSGYWLPGLLLTFVPLGISLFGLAHTRAGASLLVWVIGLFVLGIFLNALFYHLLKAPTRLGRLLLDQIDGFKLYLSVAEKDRLNLENPPERTPGLFERFLPYALALGVEQKWSEQFANVLTATGQSDAPYAPSWYVGASWNNLNAGSFANSMSSSLSGAISSASTAPGSSSGGGGGGFSGGGGGGGGGGGW